MIAAFQESRAVGLCQQLPFQAIVSLTVLTEIIAVLFMPCRFIQCRHIEKRDKETQQTPQVLNSYSEIKVEMERQGWMCTSKHFWSRYGPTHQQ